MSRQAWSVQAKFGKWCSFRPGKIHQFGDQRTLMLIQKKLLALWQRQDVKYALCVFGLGVALFLIFGPAQATVEKDLVARFSGVLLGFVCIVALNILSSRARS